jgi:hypothetical protein
VELTYLFRSFPVKTPQISFWIASAFPAFQNVGAAGLMTNSLAGLGTV